MYSECHRECLVLQVTVRSALLSCDIWMQLIAPHISARMKSKLHLVIAVEAMALTSVLSNVGTIAYGWKSRKPLNLPACVSDGPLKPNLQPLTGL
jgi:hypothetical protein